MNLKDTCSWKKSYDDPRQHIRKQRHYFVNKGPSIQSYGFSSSHVWMWEFHCKESWTAKNWTMVLEKTLESPLNCKAIQSVNPKWNQSRMFFGRTDVEAETPILWPPYAKNWLIGKDPHALQDWRQEEKGTKEDDMVGWYHRLDGHEFEQALGIGDGQWSLMCWSPWYGKSDMTEWLNGTDLSWSQSHSGQWPQISQRKIRLKIYLTYDGDIARQYLMSHLFKDLDLEIIHISGDWIGRLFVCCFLLFFPWIESHSIQTSVHQICIIHHFSQFGLP